MAKTVRSYATTNRAARQAAGAYGGRLELARLPNEMADGLRFFFNDFGEQVGFKSSFGDQIARLSGLSFGGKMAKCEAADDQWREHVTAHVKVSNHHGIHDPFAKLVEPRVRLDIRRARREWQRLGMMAARGESLLVTVLYRYYGPRPPGEVRSDVFGEVAALVEYTDEVEAQRIAMAAKLAEERCKRWGVRPERAATMSASVGADGAPIEGNGVVDSAMQRSGRAGVIAQIKCGSRPTRYESIFAQALAEVTHGDVIRAGCAPLAIVPAKGESGKDFKARREAAAGEVERWSMPIRRQAGELLIRASNAYRATVIA